METAYSSIDFFDQLKSKYKDYLRPEIISVSLLHNDGAVYIEIAESEMLEGGLEKITVRRSNLDAITDFDEDPEKPFLYFDPDTSVETNVKKFLEDFDPYSIMNTIDLFHAEACEAINKKYNIFGINK